MHSPSTHKRWRPSPLISASLALHLGAMLATVARPRLWPWTLGALVADHLLLTAAGLWPRSRLLGPNWAHLPAAAAARGAVAITIDDGPEPEVTARVLSLLDEYGVKASFFCIGERIQRYSELAREIVHRGHVIENHSHRHVHHFSLLGPRALKDEIERAQQTIGSTTGERPRFFRAPAGLRNPFLEPVLARLDLRLTSWTRRGFDTVSHSADVVFGRLTHHLKGGDILLLHDGHAARTRTGLPVILEVLPRLLETMAAAKLTPITLRAALDLQ